MLLIASVKEVKQRDQLRAKTKATSERKSVCRICTTKHHVNGNRTVEPFPEGTQMAVFGMGCFWGAERKFWTLKGVYSTQVGYAGGYTPNPTYKEVCSGNTGHAEVVRVVYQPERISFEELLKVFWENHDPTQGLRQGNDHGSQYRSAIYPTSTAHMEAALRSKEDYQKGCVSLVHQATAPSRPPSPQPHPCLLRIVPGTELMATGMEVLSIGACLKRGSVGARLRPDHHGHPGGPGFLLRGGLPPAVPEQEP
ncbi:mitochondrial peptide methionine sulfoxide reductase isoform X2 [Camelus dromedarius]|uniref:peptide-methionine (S)-S-oxide reductase n=2 Tax=Camelus TaxID=9836 RepID=A0A8B8SC56_CAMFR|nr:mitochondrial peptide methionine sulfoxide reductase isoform X2 [Camelus ferus]